MNKELLDLYVDYLITSFGKTTATGLSKLLEGAISHDRFTRMLNGKVQTSVDLWRLVKPTIRKIENKDGVLIVDDSIEEKPYTDENEIICWHWDHCKGRNVKGINFITLLYANQEMSLPIAFELISKTEQYIDIKTKKPKRRSKIGKNEYVRQMLKQAVANGVAFKYVLNDVWFASAENMCYIKLDLKKEFVMPIKPNRNIALSEMDQKNKVWTKVELLAFKDNIPQQVWVEDVPFPLLLIKQVFTNEDKSTGILYLITSDLTLSYTDITDLYQKRWKIERYHQSIKQNASLAKSPTQTVNSQSNHFFAALCAFIKLEQLRVSTHLNHFALKAKLYFAACDAAFKQLRSLQGKSLVA